MSVTDPSLPVHYFILLYPYLKLFSYCSEYITADPLDREHSINLCRCIPVCIFKGIPVCMFKGIPVCMFKSIPVCMFKGIPIYKYSQH